MHDCEKNFLTYDGSGSAKYGSGGGGGGGGPSRLASATAPMSDGALATFERRVSGLVTILSETKERFESVKGNAFGWPPLPSTAGAGCEQVSAASAVGRISFLLDDAEALADALRSQSIELSDRL